MMYKGPEPGIHEVKESDLVDERQRKEWTTT